MRRPSHDEEGRFWMGPNDLDALVEEELCKASLYPSQAHPVVDIERFIENHLGARLDQFADLGPQIQGQTVFVVGNPPLVQIQRSDSERADVECGVARFRVRMTMAHEAMHILLHSRLFSTHRSQLALLDGDTQASAGTLFRCQEIGIEDGPRRSHHYDWREIQANKGMAALLMPKEHFRDTVEEECEREKICRYRLYPGTPATWKVAARVSELLHVSKQAVLIRMTELALLVPPGQELLRFPDSGDEEDSFV